MNRSFVIIVGLVLAAGCRKPAAKTIQAADPILVRQVGFAAPESVFHDSQYDVYYISNINGAPLDQDDNGFISVVSPDGKLVGLKAIDGAADSVTLNAPKGMALAGDFLYVTDITTIRRFDRLTGGPRGEIPIPGATFLNDIVAGKDGSLYFTDSGLKAGAKGFEPSGSDAVYRIDSEGRLETLARGDSLGHPNGIALSGDTVWVASYGTNELYRIDKGQKAGVVKLPKGGLDGLVIENGEMFVSSWDGDAIYRGPIGGPFTELISHLKGPADIGYDGWRHRLLIPLLNDNEVHLIPLAP